MNINEEEIEKKEVENEEDDINSNILKLNHYLHHPRCLETFYNEIFELIDIFITTNIDPNNSPNYQLYGNNVDDLSVIITFLMDQIDFNNINNNEIKNMRISLDLPILILIKILLRKKNNRYQFGKRGISMISKLLRNTESDNNDRLKELSNIILNICYESELVPFIVETKCCEYLIYHLQNQIQRIESRIKWKKERKLSRMRALKKRNELKNNIENNNRINEEELLKISENDNDLDYDNDPNIIEINNVLISIIGAIQSICYIKVGRQEIKDKGGIQLVLPFLLNTNELIKMRAVGTIHNITADLTNLSIIRENNAIPSLIELLSSNNIEICGAAAGAIQNLSRENLSRDIIKEFDCINVLSNILVGNDIKAQVCAAGALLNIIGPSLKDEEKEKLNELIKNSLVLGMLQSCLTESYLL